MAEPGSHVHVASADPAFDRVVDVATMRALERHVAAGTDLMARAGAALAQELIRRLLGSDRMTLVMLVGPGDNGGDCLILARHLAQDGADIVCWASRERADDPLVQAAVESGARWRVWDRDDRALAADVQRATAVVDGLLGIGSAPPLRGVVAEMLAALPDVRGQPRIAIDVPSGIDADEGTADPGTFAATLTLSTGPIKIGLLLHSAIEYAGEIAALDIDLARDDLAGVSSAVLHRATVRELVPPRPAAAHKGTFGRLLIVGGSVRYRGAPRWRHLRSWAQAPGWSPWRPWRPRWPRRRRTPHRPPSGPCRRGRKVESRPVPPTCWLRARRPDALVVGPGLGRSRASDALACALAGMETAQIPRLIDADGLNALSAAPEVLGAVGEQAVLTPHPGELARLLDLTEPPEGQARRRAAQTLARRSGATVVAKGSPTFVCAGDACWILARPNPVLAAAGSGDVLAGVIGALLAQGLAPTAAARLGVWLHAEGAQIAAGGSDRGVPMERVARSIERAFGRLR